MTQTVGKDKLEQILQQPKYEAIPMKGIDKQIPHMPSFSKVSVTCSPTKGIAETLRLSAEVAAQVSGANTIPHLAARLMESPEHVSETLETLRQMGVKEIFIVGGDAPEPIGPYVGSYDLVKEIAEQTDDFKLGVTCYPEGHATISDEVLMEDLLRKQPYASYMATQMCFDADVIGKWLMDMRAKGVTLPVHVGVPGVIDMVKLIKISTRIGIGDSLKYLQKHAGNVLKLMGGYNPDMLIEGLMPYFENPEANIENFHIYTFNQIEKTENWRVNKMASLKEVA